MSLLRLVLACLGVLEPTLATVGTVGMRAGICISHAGSAYGWVGTGKGELGMYP